MKRTKIVCTIGPSTDSKEALRQLLLSGMDVARLNFSHGTHEWHAEIIKILRELEEELNRPVGILVDLCGPKIRTGELNAEEVVLKDGQEFILSCDEIIGDDKRVSISYSHLCSDVKAGERVLLDDGLLELKVKSVDAPNVICDVIFGGILKPHKGVNFPSVKLSISSITEKDIEDLAFAVKYDPDFIAFSFVRTASDVMRLKELIQIENKNIPVISKIEKVEAVENFDEILSVSDGIMIARGDMGVELEFERVPIIQKDIIKKCNRVSKPVITATQMLDSMIRNPRPTRAEATDVANAVIDGTDAIMLSGETASGKYPLEAVKTMVKIAESAEKVLPYEAIYAQGSAAKMTDAISLATCEIAEALKARAVVTFTSSGRTAKLLSKYRPRSLVFAITESLKAYRSLTLCWGVIPIYVAEFLDTDKAFNMAEEKLLKSNYLKNGDITVFTAGIPFGISGSTNMIKISVMGSSFLRGKSVEIDGKPEKFSGRVCKGDEIKQISNNLEDGDILLSHNFHMDYEILFSRISAMIIEEDIGSIISDYLKKKKIPVVYAIPGAFDSISDDIIVNLDLKLGFLSWGH